MAAHKAANNIARTFLDETDLETLLLIDDDMIFEADTLEKIRKNRKTWEYDIVSAYATTRAIPPKPIIMRLLDEQPGFPFHLQGEMYEHTYEFPWFEVVPVDSTGLAFTLIRRKVLEAMIRDKIGLQFTYFFEYERGLETEDISFCRKARIAGFSLAVDTNAQIKHIGQIALGHEEFASWYINMRGNDDE